MTNQATKENRKFSRGELALVSLFVCGLLSVVALARTIESRRASGEREATLRATEDSPEDELYLSGKTARRLSLCFNGLAADWYWLKTQQYVGNRAIAYRATHNDSLPPLDDLSALKLNALAPLLERTTTLDPQFVAAYEYGAVILPSFDAEAAIRLLKKGIAANPNEWRLRERLGYIYWQQNRFKEASDAYREGAQLPGAPAWMNALAAQMLAAGGGRDTARQIYEQMYRNATDAQLQKVALLRLMQLKSLDERDAIRRALEEFKTKNARCPAAWRELAPQLRAMNFTFDQSGAPIDPSGAPYLLNQTRCDVDLDARSEIPRK